VQDDAISCDKKEEAIPEANMPAEDYQMEKDEDNYDDDVEDEHDKKDAVEAAEGNPSSQ